MNIVFFGQKLACTEIQPVLMFVHIPDVGLPAVLPGWRLGHAFVTSVVATIHEKRSVQFLALLVNTVDLRKSHCDCCSAIPNVPTAYIISSMIDAVWRARGRQFWRYTYNCIDARISLTFYFKFCIIHENCLCSP